MGKRQRQEVEGHNERHKDVIYKIKQETTSPILSMKGDYSGTGLPLTQYLYISYSELATVIFKSKQTFAFFADSSRCHGRPVCVPQQPPARRRSGRHGDPGTAERRQVRVAPETRGLCQDLAQSLVCSARGSAPILQGRGGDQSPGKTVDTLKSQKHDNCVTHSRFQTAVNQQISWISLLAQQIWGGWSWAADQTRADRCR